MPMSDLLAICEASGITLEDALTDYIRGAKISERMRLLEVYESQGLDALLSELRDRGGR